MRLPAAILLLEYCLLRPVGNLAIFHKDFRYSDGLVILGKIDSGMEALNVPGSAKVTIEFVK